MLESRGKRYSNCYMSFLWRDKKYEFNSTGAKDLYRDVIDWLYKTGYEFTGSYHTNPTRKIHTTDEVREKVSSTAYSFKDFHNIPDTNKWIMCATPIKELFTGLIKMLRLHSVNSIITSGMDLEDIDDSKVINATDFMKNLSNQEVDDVYSEENPVNKPSVRNPFGGESKSKGDPFDTSALFVVGESGSGKSTRILKLLRSNEHKTLLMGAENITPNVMFDYDQNEGFYTSDVGDFLIAAKNDPTHFYTVIFDECHEYISEIKRSIFHAISSKRGEKRFFSVKKSVRKFFSVLGDYEVSGKVVPDNVGFIFISSKPDVFEYHPDFMGRVDKIVVHRDDPYPYPDLKFIQNKIDRQEQL